MIVDYMGVGKDQNNDEKETKHPTKRVFMRAERDDVIKFTDIVEIFYENSIPDTATVIKRDMTYYGPKIRVECNTSSEQYLLTAPGPKTEAIFWYQTSGGWKEMAEVCIEFQGSPPKYDLCLHCNEPISTIEHRRRSIIGACSNM